MSQPTWITNLFRRIAHGAAVVGFLSASSTALGQIANELPAPRDEKRLEHPSQDTRDKEAGLIEAVLEPELLFRVDPTQSKIVRTKLPVARIAITDPSVVEVNEFGPNEFEVIGLQAGQTTLTMWFTNPDDTTTVLRYLVKVAADEREQERADVEYGKLQSRINEMFPNSQVQLVPVADKLIVRGQARDSKEAAEILAVIGGQAVDQAGNISVNLGSVARLPGAPNLQTTSVINLLHVPGEQQVMLKVRIAELNRTAARELGMDFSLVENAFAISNFVGGAGNLTAILDGGDLALFMRAFSTNGNAKILAEPNLVTLSGKTATFIAGGEFAVPTAVGVNGIGAVTTTFRGFGTQVAFTPTVMDKDKIRLQVAPSFSSINQNIAVDGIPGLDTRAVTTTVDLREGQWFAIAGLIQDEQGGSRTRIPFLGDIPVIGAAFGSQNTTRNETELVILVSPELVHPLEPEQVPLLLPGVEVTDPTDWEFFIHQQVEGIPNEHHRSTIWPAYRHQLRHQNKEIIRGARQARHGSQQCQDFYISGPQGFSQ